MPRPVWGVPLVLLLLLGACAPQATTTTTTSAPIQQSLSAPKVLT